MMTISKLKSFINKKYPGKTPYFQHLAKEKNNRNLSLALYVSSSHAMIFSELEAIIYFSPSGKITKVLDRKYQPHLKLNALISQVVDLDSFPNWWDKIVHENIGGSRGHYWTGFINKGHFTPFTVPNLLAYSFPTIYNENGDEYRNFEVVKVFKDFIKKHQKEIKSFYIYEEHSTDFRFDLEIKGLKVSLVLSKFFSYSLTARIFSPNQNATGFSSVVELLNLEVENFDEVLNELKTKKLSLTTKAKILATFKGAQWISLDEVPTQNLVVAEVKFDGNKGRPRGKYAFTLDFNNKLVSCSGSSSKKYIPQKVAELNQNLRELEKNNYYF